MSDSLPFEKLLVAVKSKFATAKANKRVPKREYNEELSGGDMGAPQWQPIEFYVSDPTPVIDTGANDKVN